MLPSRLSSAVVTATLLLCCLFHAAHGQGDSGEAIIANLTSVDLAVYTDRVTFLPMNDIVLAYRLVDSSTAITATMGSVAINLAAMQEGDIDFAMSAQLTRCCLPFGCVARDGEEL